jgi:hypothetical protein
MASKSTGPKGIGSKGIGPIKPGKVPDPPNRQKAQNRQTSQKRQQVIPEAVSNRMARRIAIATGVPTIMGMGVFIGSYLLVTRHIAEVPTGVTLAASGGCFLLGVLGLSYGVLSASWEDAPGSLLGNEQIGVNISRLRSSLKAMRKGNSPE